MAPTDASRGNRASADLLPIDGKSSPDSEHVLKRRPTVPEVYEVDLNGPDPYDVTALIISTWACPVIGCCAAMRSIRRATPSSWEMSARQ